MRLVRILCVLLLALPAALPAADEPDGFQDPLPKALRQRAEARLHQAAGFLCDRQQEDGGFGMRGQPALAALGAIALNGCPAPYPQHRDDVVDRALQRLLDAAREDGGIHSGGVRAYPCYNTAISLLALSSIPREEHLPVIQKARKYLLSAQVLAPGTPQHGGFSYAPGADAGRADLSNSAWVAEALYVSEPLVKDLPTTPKDATKENARMWSRLRTFLDHTQNLPTTPEDKWLEEGSDMGGFGYQAKERPSDIVVSGSMTYAGWKSMVYAKVDKDDVRVKAVMRYLSQNYTLKKNPGQDQAGYYYYVLALAKALDAAGVDVVRTTDGEVHHWRHELVLELLDRQKIDGSWANPEGRFMESMPELATAYAVIAMRTAMRRP